MIKIHKINFRVIKIPLWIVNAYLKKSQSMTNFLIAFCMLIKYVEFFPLQMHNKSEKGRAMYLLVPLSILWLST